MYTLMAPVFVKTAVKALDGSTALPRFACAPWSAANDNPQNFRWPVAR